MDPSGPRETTLCRGGGVSWWLLLVATGGVGAVLGGLRSTVYYTAGEVMQGLFTLGSLAALAGVFLGFHRRNVALWWVLILGGSLILGQAWQIRRWAVIHEDIVALVRFAEQHKARTGRYPDGADSFTFSRPWVRRHVMTAGSDSTNGFRVHYFINDPGISYWYTSAGGFGYYPD